MLSNLHISRGLYQLGTFGVREKGCIQMCSIYVEGMEFMNKPFS